MATIKGIGLALANVFVVATGMSVLRTTARCSCSS